MCAQSSCKSVPVPRKGGGAFQADVKEEHLIRRGGGHNTANPQSVKLHYKEKSYLSILVNILNSFLQHQGEPKWQKVSSYCEEEAWASAQKSDITGLCSAQLPATWGPTLIQSNQSLTKQPFVYKFTENIRLFKPNQQNFSLLPELCSSKCPELIKQRKRWSQRNYLSSDPSNRI